MNATFEFSTNGGVTWSMATPTPASATPNPAVGLPVATVAMFEWDSRTDMVGLVALEPGVMFRAVVDDGVSLLTGVCSSPAFDVDNTAICFMTCGDCDLNGVGPNVVDALQAAQIAAGILVPTFLQTGCCDVNSTMSIDVIDSLIMAQAAAGLSAVLICP